MSSRRALALLPMILLLTWAGLVEAEGNRWKQLGPATGATIVLMDPVVPAVLYAQSGPRLFRSLDAGANWQLMTDSLPPQDLSVALVVSPEAPGALYARPSNGSNRIFKSSDGGNSWSELQTDLGAGSLAWMTAAATTPTTLYVGRGLSCDVFTGCSGGGVYRSTNGGTRWKASGLPGRVLYTLRASPTSPDLIYGHSVGEFFRSTDGGGSWTVRPPPAGSFGCLGCPLALDPDQSSTVYLGQVRGVFKSTTSGETWSLLTGGLPKIDDFNLGEVYFGASAIVIDPSDSNTVYAGFAVRGDAIFARLGGVFGSCDAGSTWSSMNDGLSNLYVNSLAIDSSGKHLYAGTDAGISELDFTQRPAIEPVRRPVRPRALPPRQ